MDRIKRVAHQILETYRDAFTDDFEKNKEVLEEVAEIRSKYLRNHIAGVITRLIKENAPKEAETMEATLREVA